MGLVSEPAPGSVGPPASAVLVVDDESVVVESITATLQAEGYGVAGATDPTTALNWVQQREFGLVLTDQRMPHLTGLELLEQVQRIQPDTTRVLMTGVVELSTVIDCINRGQLYRFLVKPWLREELLATVHNGLQRYELIRRNAQLQQATLAMNERLQQLNRALQQQLQREAAQNQRLAALNQALEQNLNRSVELCLRTMQTFYPRLGTQARRVHQLACCIADGLKLAETDRQVFELAAWLHDIGLLGLPRRLITLWQKVPESLSRAERALIQQHPILGEELAGFVHHLAGVGPIIRAHHERFDGTGYPDQLVGEEIPWLARLLAVVVGFVQAELTGADAEAHVRTEAGTAYDPEAVRVLLRYRPQCGPPRREREVPLAELAPGMVLAKPIYTAHGLLLLPEGQVLTEACIAKIHNHNRLAPIRQTFTVYC
jgi:response regulator RpfG family c-di-GMP phosphodiesterase